MSFLSSPKVRLALIVNGLYFISLVMPTTPHTRPRYFMRGDERYDARALPKTPSTYAPLAPPTAVAPKAVANFVKKYDQLDVSLTDDLTLVRKPEHTLVLSPIFTTKMSGTEQPRSILMRFVSYSPQQSLDRYPPFVIVADGVEVWRSGAGANPHYSVAHGDSGQVIETLGQDIPYDLFLDVISARRVIVALGDDMAELNAEQIEALRDMHRHLPQPPEDPPTPTADQTGKADGVVTEPKISRDYIYSQPPDRRRHR